jgi:hypothetical protein
VIGICRALALGVVLLSAVLTVPASAHQADPRIVTTLDDVVPALPEEVVVQVQASLAAQLVVDNPTSTLLEVLGQNGEPFLRLSAAGVQADVTSEAFLTTSNPNGGAPFVDDDRPPTWVTISTGTSWGWFDHRLHPQDTAAPPDEQRDAELGKWTVPLRYGGEPVELRGSVRFEPLLGTFLVSADPVPGGLVVQALPGRLPGVFLSNPQRTPLTVLGRDGEPFLRFGPRGLEVNTVSRTYVEDRRARGLAAGPPSPDPEFEVVDPQGTSYTWLDARLRYPQERPPDAVVQAAEPTVVDTWRVPIDGVDDVPAFTGEIRWVPERAAAAAASDASDPTRDGGVLLPATVAVVALAVLAAAVLLLRRRHRAAQR